MELDSVQIGTADVEEVTAAYTLLVGVEPLCLGVCRSGGITLEFATGHPPPAEADAPDRLYGVSYRVADLEARRERLLRAGVDVSPVRDGMRPGTSVVTVLSGTAVVPTLLL